MKEAIEDAGCHLLFLPPYSPDLNPIEHVWSPLKNRVRMKLDQDEINLEAALSQVMKSIAKGLIPRSLLRKKTKRITTRRGNFPKYLVACCEDR
ncbi:hypothetical protein PsalMR5_02570 [Piscirickettsia salmonis]|nr:hypothetical protein PsalSR1_02570 [Piscirickettsia salmonis]QGP64691.1 hypothetical protein PsalMR5_02570 [Piscirickettsia salmonis]